MQKTIEEFDSASITNFGIKFKGEEEAQSFGCVGQIEGETEMLTKIKKCEGLEVKSKSKPHKMTLKINAHVKVDPLRKIFGLSNEGLKPGVYAYGSDSKGTDFVLTADVVDDFEDLTKLIAFPNCSSSTGLTLSIENGADEVAELEMEFTAMIDDNKKCYYEALIEELEDEEVAENWRKNFSADLVKVTTP
ncbi:hypothetical protein J6TS2_33630 [Heyndrickxia sporothermodurans]|nr:hypothetical protein J6TS2_33630 [Heyndrickxia sporothermodurans]